MEYFATFWYKTLVVNAGKYSSTMEHMVIWYTWVSHGYLIASISNFGTTRTGAGWFLIPNWSSWTHGPNVGQFLITWINVHLHWYYDPIFVATTNRVGLPRYIPPIVQQLNPAMDRNHEDSLFGMANGQHHEDCLFNKKICCLVGATYPSEKWWTESQYVSDDEIPSCFWKVIQNSMVPNHQPDMMFGGYSPDNSQEKCTIHEHPPCFS